MKKPDKESPKFEIKKRVPKEKPNLFANVTPLRHPISEILNFPAEQTPAEHSRAATDLDIQIKNDLISKDDSIGYPKEQKLDIQTKDTGYPNQSETDIQTEKLVISKDENNGYPKKQNLDIMISKSDLRISKEPTSLDIKISKEKKSDIQKTEKTEKTGKWEKYDTKRKGKGLFLRTNEDLTKEFKQFCIRQGWDFSYGTELAWKGIMESLDIQKEGSLDIMISHDDRRLRLLFKTKPTIINLYLQYNSVFNPKTKWSVKDDEAASKFNEVDLRLIELGIIQTQGNKNFAGKINSFGYYAHEIQAFIDLSLPAESIETMLEINRKRWQMATGKTVKNEFSEN